MSKPRWLPTALSALLGAVMLYVSILTGTVVHALVVGLLMGIHGLLSYWEGMIDWHEYEREADTTYTKR